MDDIIATQKHDIPLILSTKGVCIVPNVLSETTCDNIFNGMVWDFEERTKNLPSPFVFERPETWNTLDLFYPKHHMLYQHWCLGQSEYIWKYVRTDPDIIECFSNIWGTNQLIVSFDGISFHLPSEISGKKHFSESEKHWFHFDQSFLKPNLECVQGLVNSMNTNPGDATLKVMVGSHNCFGEYASMRIDDFVIGNGGKADEAQLKKQFGENWNRVDDLEFFTKRGCYELEIVCPRGSLVLWDSRTLHYGKQPSKDRERINFRSVVYVCMVPYTRISEYTYSSKVFSERSFKYYNEGRMTNHWPQFRKLTTAMATDRFNKIEDPGFNYPTPIKPTKRMYELITGDYSVI